MRLGTSLVLHLLVLLERNNEQTQPACELAIDPHTSIINGQGRGYGLVRIQFGGETEDLSDIEEGRYPLFMPKRRWLSTRIYSNQRGDGYQQEYTPVLLGMLLSLTKVNKSFESYFLCFSLPILLILTWFGAHFICIVI